MGWLSKYKTGGVIKDDMGQWNHPGEITEINSNNITMKGVPYPVLGVSDTGQAQMMYPEQNYKFKGKKVTEYPMMQDGGTIKAQKGAKVKRKSILDGMEPNVPNYVNNLSDNTFVSTKVDLKTVHNQKPLNYDKNVETFIKNGSSKRLAEYDAGRKKFTKTQLDQIKYDQEVERKVTNHPDYNPSKSIESQKSFVNDNSLGTRLYRGSREFSNTGNSAIDFAAGLLTAPGKSFVDLSYPQKYIDEGAKGIPRFLTDVLNVAPTAVMNNTIKGISGANKALTKAGKYLTEETALKNAYKLNPKSFKPNSESFYRQIGDGVDALKSGVIRSADSRTFPRPNFVEGKDFDMLRSTGSGATKKNNIIAEMPMVKDGEMTAYQANSTQGYSPYQANLKEVPLSDVKLFKKDWLQGYKQIKIPKSNFNSEINWNNWNKEIPTNTPLLKEYNTIEQTAKQNGSWMKNADGSEFTGTPEQFVQQQSDNFKKAFPEGFEETYRGSAVHNPELTSKDSPFFEKSVFTGDENLAHAYANAYSNRNYKEYFNPNVITGEELLLKNHPFKDLNVAKLDSKNRGLIRAYSQSEDAGTYKLYSKNDKNKIIIDAKNSDWKNLPQQKDLPILKSNDDVAEYIDKNNIGQAFINNVSDGVTGNVLISNHKKGNYLKSMIGNNGMFDMANPNIYKTLLPPTITAGWLNKYNNK